MGPVPTHFGTGVKTPYFLMENRMGVVPKNAPPLGSYINFPRCIPRFTKTQLRPQTLVICRLSRPISFETLLFWRFYVACQGWVGMQTKAANGKELL